jgi:hypothetical protein
MNLNLNRFQVALMSLNGSTLHELSSNLSQAVIECEAFGSNPLTDAAVLLLNVQISFMTNVDMATAGTYDSLVAACQNNAAIPLIDPTEIH